MIWIFRPYDVIIQINKISLFFQFSKILNCQNHWSKGKTLTIVNRTILQQYGTSKKDWLKPVLLIGSKEQFHEKDIGMMIFSTFSKVCLTSVSFCDRIRFCQLNSLSISIRRCQKNRNVFPQCYRISQKYFSSNVSNFIHIEFHLNKIENQSKTARIPIS